MYVLGRWLRWYNLPAMQEAWVRSLGQHDPREEGMPTHSSILAWRILQTGAWRAVVHCCRDMAEVTEHACTGIMRPLQISDAV